MRASSERFLSGQISGAAGLKGIAWIYSWVAIVIDKVASRSQPFKPQTTCPPAQKALSWRRAVQAPRPFEGCERDVCALLLGLTGKIAGKKPLPRAIEV